MVCVWSLCPAALRFPSFEGLLDDTLRRCTLILVLYSHRIAEVCDMTEMDCPIMPVDSRLWFGADGRVAKGGVCVCVGRGGGAHRCLVAAGAGVAAAAGGGGDTALPPPLLWIQGAVDMGRWTALPLCSTVTVLPIL